MKKNFIRRTKEAVTVTYENKEQIKLLMKAYQGLIISVLLLLLIN